MKKIIHGKTYNTETATVIRCWEDFEPSDARWHETGLYRTRGGDYFLAGVGGVSSMWGSTELPREYVCSRGGIVPFDSDDELLKYMELNDFTEDEIAAVFG